MKNQKALIYTTFSLLFLLAGCSSELKKIKKQRELTTECYESLKLVKNSLVRSPNGLTLQLKQKYLVGKSNRTNRINAMKESFFSNVIECWSKNFTQADIEGLFGKPTTNRGLSYEYVILNKSCTVENGEIVKGFDCGQLRFTFGQDGVVNNGMLFLPE